MHETGQDFSVMVFSGWFSVLTCQSKTKSSIQKSALNTHAQTHTYKYTSSHTLGTLKTSVAAPW